MTKSPRIRACPKRKPYRDRNLLDMARGKKCLLRVPGVCNNNPETTVACHSNKLVHGKGMSQKAHDAYTVWGCSSCHAWLDQGKASAEKKDEIYRSATIAQHLKWIDILHDKTSSKKDKQSVRGAFDFLTEFEEEQLSFVR